LHNYTQESQGDLEQVRAQVQAEVERLRLQEQSLNRARADHRLAVTAFRQQLIDWQGRVAEMKEFMASNETRLDQRQAEVAEAARQIDATTQELARQAEELQEQQREVAERRTEIETHLGDMREWYRKKLRELVGNRAGIHVDEPILPMPTAEGTPSQSAENSEPARILTLADDLEPGDRTLGELLRELDLVDGETLHSLWAEARRQRRTLRQVLLSSGAITLYQLAIIEAGNVDKLMLGMFRVIDRFQVTPREALYRVYDPRRGENHLEPALLRQLAESEMSDAIRPDEYRSRFAAVAELKHPNIAATYEVLDVNGRPAVLQEWLSGLPSSEWPPMAATAGVWFRLVSQATLGLYLAHQNGLIHGRLTPASFVLTQEGLVKLCGLGEPSWLSTKAVSPEATIIDDLRALGRIAYEWSMLAPPKKKGGKAVKPLPDSLDSILVKLGSEPDSSDMLYTSAEELLTELDRAGENIPAHSEAWEKLLEHVRSNAAEGPSLRRQSA